MLSATDEIVLTVLIQDPTQNRGDRFQNARCTINGGY
jgi:hypothetical protein